MKNSRVTFNLLDRDDHAPVGYKYISCHLIFDFKMDPARKASYIYEGHITNPPSSMINTSMISYDSSRLFFLIEELNDLDILAEEIWIFPSPYKNLISALLAKDLPRFL